MVTSGFRTCHSSGDAKWLALLMLIKAVVAVDSSQWQATCRASDSKESE